MIITFHFKTTAIALKEAGYDVPCNTRYPGTDKPEECLVLNWNADAGVLCSAPTLSDAAKWLRDVKGLHVYVFQSKDKTWMYLVERTPRTTEVWHGVIFPDHDTAYAAGIGRALTILKERT